MLGEEGESSQNSKIAKHRAQNVVTVPLHARIRLRILTFPKSCNSRSLMHRATFIYVSRDFVVCMLCKGLISSNGR